jgi:hypothetical protein
MFTSSFQDLQSPSGPAHFVPSPTGTCTYRWSSPPRWVWRRERWGIHGIPCGHKASQGSLYGHHDKTFKVQAFKPSTNPTRYHHSPSVQFFCREVIAWRHLSHPNILPLEGVSMSADPPRFVILSEWMPHGDVMNYTKLNPKANRLRLVGHLPFLRSSIHEKLLALRGRIWGGPPSQTPVSSTEISKAYVQYARHPFPLVNKRNRQTSSSITRAPLVLETFGLVNDD